MTKSGGLITVVVLIATAACTASGSPMPTALAQAPSQEFTAFVTGYTYYTNTPVKSAVVSHPVLHREAGGQGSFADPITVAVGWTKNGNKSTLDFPAGTKFYMPYLDKYFIVEDTCGDGDKPQNIACHTGYKAPAKAWLDIWVDGEGLGAEKALDCAESITGNHQIIKDPAPNLKYTAGDVCD